MSAAAAPPIVASVVVATRDRERTLGRLLDALERQTLARDRFEIVIVDDASKDGTAALLAAAGATAHGPFQSFRQPVGGGPAAARNRGWRAASGAIIAFTDDDCRPEAGWLAAGIAALEAGRGVVMGRTVPDPTAPDAREPFARTMEVAHEDGRYPTCNVFYRREALEAVGGFDESFRYACGEDTDLAWRVRKTGLQAAFAGDAVVEHEVRAPDFPLFLRERRRFAEQILVLKRHPELRRLYYRRFFYRRCHVHAIATVLVCIAALLLSPVLLLLLPVVWAHRMRGTSLGRGGLAERSVTLAKILVSDLWELAVFAAMSVRYRTLLL